MCYACLLIPSRRAYILFHFHRYHNYFIQLNHIQVIHRHSTVHFLMHFKSPYEKNLMLYFTGGNLKVAFVGHGQWKRK